MAILKCRNCGSSKTYDILPETDGLCEICFENQGKVEVPEVPREPEPAIIPTLLSSPVVKIPTPVKVSPKKVIKKKRK